MQRKKKNLVWGPCKLNLWNITLFLFSPLLCFFSICVMVINYILWKELKTFCFVIFAVDFFSLPVILKIHREISNYGIEIPLCQHLQSIIQKKQKTSCWVVCSVLVWTSVSAVHTSFFFTESSFWNKDSVFSECSETFVGPYILNL